MRYLRRARLNADNRRRVGSDYSQLRIPLERYEPQTAPLICARDSAPDDKRSRTIVAVENGKAGAASAGLDEGKREREN